MGRTQSGLGRDKSTWPAGGEWEVEGRGQSGAHCRREASSGHSALSGKESK